MCVCVHACVLCAYVCMCVCVFIRGGAWCHGGDDGDKLYIFCNNSPLVTCMSLEVTSGGKEKRINFLLQSIMWMFIFPLKGRFEKTKAGRREGEGRMEGGREREGEALTLKMLQWLVTCVCNLKMYPDIVLDTWLVERQKWRLLENATSLKMLGVSIPLSAARIFSPRSACPPLCP